MFSQKIPLSWVIKNISLVKKLPIEFTVMPIFFMAQKLEMMIDDILKEKFESSHAQTKVMMNLHFEKYLTQKEIAIFWNVSEASISRQVKILLKKWMIVKAEDKDDERKSKISLTPQGKKMISQFKKAVDTKMEELFASISHEDRKNMTEIVIKFIKIINQQSRYKIKLPFKI